MGAELRLQILSDTDWNLGFASYQCVILVSLVVSLSFNFLCKTHTITILS